MPVYSRAGHWRIAAPLVVPSPTAVPTGAFTRALPYDPPLTGSATKLIDHEQSNWPATGTGDDDKHADRHALRRTRRGPERMCGVSWCSE